MMDEALASAFFSFPAAVAADARPVCFVLFLVTMRDRCQCSNSSANNNAFGRSNVGSDDEGHSRAPALSGYFLLDSLAVERRALHPIGIRHVEGEFNGRRICQVFGGRVSVAGAGKNRRATDDGAGVDDLGGERRRRIDFNVAGEVLRRAGQRAISYGRAAQRPFVCDRGAGSGMRPACGALDALPGREDSSRQARRVNRLVGAVAGQLRGYALQAAGNQVSALNRNHRLVGKVVVAARGGDRSQRASIQFEVGGIDVEGVHIRPATAHRAITSGDCPKVVRLWPAIWIPPLTMLLLSPLPASATSVAPDEVSPNTSVDTPLGLPCTNVFGWNVNAWLPNAMPLLR